MTEQPKTLGEILKSASDYLAGKGVENPKLLCDILAARLLNCRPLELPLHYSSVMNERHLEAMRRGVKRLAQHEPIQYITGQTGFMEHTFKTDKRALIPRPETECLVQLVIDHKELWQKEKPAIVEIGTGSGCIIISLALAKPQALYIAIDVSEDALQLARENAAMLKAGPNLAFTTTELADTVEPETIDAIIANLPYIPTPEYEQLPPNVKNFEPRLALDGGPNGLAVIEPAVQDAAFALKPGGLIFLEIGETQGNTVRKILEETGYEQIQIHKDLNNKDRIVTARTTKA